MAAAEIRRQWRVSARAWRKLKRRRIKPSTALFVLARSCWKTVQLLSRISFLLVGGAVLAVLMVAVRLAVRVFRGGSS